MKNVEALRIIKLSAFLFITFFVLLACSTSTNKDSFTKIGELHISLQDNKQDIWSYSNHIIEIDNKEYLAYASKKKKELNFINIKNNEKEYVVSLTEATNSYDFSYNDLKFYVHNLDSIFILPNETKSMFLINKNGNIINEWTLNQENYNYDFLLSGFVSSSFRYYKGNIYVRFVPRINQFKNLEFYHTILPELILNIKNNTIRFGGGWPEKYKTENYYDSYPSAIILSDSIIYSFAASHEIYVFKDSLIEKHKAKSNFISTFEIFPTDSVGNISFTVKYLTTTPRYGSLFYDKFRKQYYRTVFHATEYENEDKKTVKGSLDQPWSLMVLNKSFNVINEIVFNPHEYAFGPIFITKKGVLLPKRENKTAISDVREWYFDLIIF